MWEEKALWGTAKERQTILSGRYGKK